MFTVVYQVRPAAACNLYDVMMVFDERAQAEGLLMYLRAYPEAGQFAAVFADQPMDPKLFKILTEERI